MLLEQSHFEGEQTNLPTLARTVYINNPTLPIRKKQLKKQKLCTEE